MDAPLQVGDTTVHKVLEFVAPFANALRFLPDLGEERLEAARSWLGPDDLDPETGKLVLSFHSWVVRTPGLVVLIDSCVGNHKDVPSIRSFHQRSSDRYERSLHEAGFGVDDVDVVLCTHMHVDHIGWNTRLADGRWVPTFPNARYLFSRTEYAHSTALHAEAPMPTMVESVLPVVEAGQAEVVDDTHEVSEAVRLLPTPGHTPGHSAVSVRSRGAEARFTGDLTHHPVQLRWPEVSSRSDDDPVLAATTRRAFFEDALGSGARVCTMHYPTRSSGFVEHWEDGFRFRPGLL